MALADSAEQPLVAVRVYSYWFMFAQHLEARSVGLVPEAVQDFIADGLLQPLARECTNERDEGRKCSVIVQLIIQTCALPISRLNDELDDHRAFASFVA